MQAQFLKDLSKTSLSLNDKINVKGGRRPNPLTFSGNYQMFANKNDFKKDFREIRKAAKAVKKAKASVVVERLGMSINVL